MKAYMVHDGEPQDDAILVFANSSKEAKNLGWNALVWCDEYTAVRVQWQKNSPWLFDQLPEKQIKMAKGDQAFVADPWACETCGMWGLEMAKDGYCLDHDPDERPIT